MVSSMEETLCNIEILRRGNLFIARIQSELGGTREFRNASFEQLLEQVAIELQEEFESEV